MIRSTGGKGGGGTTLTPRAVALINTFRAVEREHRLFLERAGAAIAGFSDDWKLIGRIGMKTSARNQLYGKVAALRRGSVNDEVSLLLPGGQTIVAVLTHESTETLGLAGIWSSLPTWSFAHQPHETQIVIVAAMAAMIIAAIALAAIPAAAYAWINFTMRPENAARVIKSVGKLS